MVGGQKGLPNGGNALVFGLETTLGNALAVTARHFCLDLGRKQLFG